MYEAKYKNFKTGDTNHFTIQFCEMRKTFINNDAHHLLKKIDAHHFTSKFYKGILSKI